MIYLTLIYRAEVRVSSVVMR